MAKPIITVTDLSNGFRKIAFEIPGGVTSPAEFAEAVNEAEKQITGDKPVLLNGRGPVWGYGMLIHAAHPTPAVATFDPRLGYVVVQSHDERFKIGDTIADPEVVHVVRPPF